ncbi:MAG: peptidoglycan-binding domain-containing protein [Candidatus Omnitrophota bacterium]
MKSSRLSLAVLLGLALVITGCGKKAADQGFAGTGFDTLATTEELAQLPQANTASQQAAIEVLPIEPSPVTPQAAAPIAPLEPAATTTQALSRDRQIQTALKNAGIYQGNIDGKIGPMTKKAIESFQANNGLKVDGKVGPRTWAALEPYLTGGARSSMSSTQQ